ncbi:Yos1 protein [Martiniozyma asiatica (nom. inval.)]|nr:Yos1 protein [Martiniozyma asiatica]
MFGLGSLFYAIVFFLNGLAVLSEDRFLARIGWSNKPQFQFGYDANGPEGISARLVSLITGVRFLRNPLIAVNVLVIVYQLVLG